MKTLLKDLFEDNGGGKGSLLINSCQRCGISFFPQRTKCIKCFKGDMLKNSRLSKEGTLYTYTLVHQAPPMFESPYIIGYIDFEDEGVRVFARLTGCKPEDLKVGMKMKLVFEDLILSDGNPNIFIYKFTPA